MTLDLLAATALILFGTLSGVIGYLLALSMHGGNTVTLELRNGKIQAWEVPIGVTVAIEDKDTNSVQVVERFDTAVKRPLRPRV